MIKTVALAKSIANDIEVLGHWQGPGSNRDNEYSVCPVLAPSYKRASQEDQNNFVFAICECIGKPQKKREEAYSTIYSWNDRTPTAEVLSVLRSIDLD